MKLSHYIATFRSASRLITNHPPRLAWKFIYNFGIRSMINISGFEKRVRRGKPFFPAFVMISVTNSCNLSCGGCWVTQNPKAQLSIEQLESIIAQSKARGSYFFGILGGEPLLYKGLLDIFDRHKDCYFQLFTNGILLTPEVASRLRKAGNVTPLISIEGLKEESDRRRGHKQVFERSIDGLRAARSKRLIVGAAASICRSNLRELTSREYLQRLADEGVLYIWYYIYRPVGADPQPENALTEDEIRDLRQFIVDARRDSPIMVIDAYWDDQGNGLCPAAVGLSHHISPSGAVEFCPPLQMACDFLNKDGSNMTDIFANSQFLSDFREFVASTSRGCVIMEEPQALADFLARYTEIVDTSGRYNLIKQLRSMRPVAGHSMKGQQIPDQNPFYKFAKKRYFFGFGAYG